MSDKTILDLDNRDKETPQLPCDNCGKLTNYFIKQYPSTIMVDCYKCSNDADFEYDEREDNKLSHDRPRED